MFMKGINLIPVIFYSVHVSAKGIQGRAPFTCKATLEKQTSQREFQNSSYFEVASRSFFLNHNLYWPSGIVPYEIDTLFSGYQIGFIKGMMKIFEDNSCVHWVPHGNEEDYVYFAKVYTPGLCNSHIGRRGLKQLLSLNDMCFEIDVGFQGAILHEMMHTLGFIHEQQRLDRNCYVNVRESALKNSESDFAMILDTSTDFPYDLGSIMHYGISKNMQMMNSPKVHQHMGNVEGELTMIDIMKLNFMYCGGPSYCELYPANCAMFEEARRRCTTILKSGKETIDIS